MGWLDRIRSLFAHAPPAPDVPEPRLMRRRSPALATDAPERLADAGPGAVPAPAGAAVPAAAPAEAAPSAPVAGPGRPEPQMEVDPPYPVEEEDDMTMPHSDRDDSFEGVRSYPSKDLIMPEVVKSFNEFSHLLHNMNVKMAAQSDQNVALLRSLEILPAIIKDIPRTRELEHNLLAEITGVIKESRTEKSRIAERMTDVKSAMLALEENGRAQISFLEGKERAHREQLNLMREYMDRERRNHRNNLAAVIMVTVLAVGLLCGAAYYFLYAEVRGRLRELELLNDRKPVAPQVIYMPAPAAAPMPVRPAPAAGTTAAPAAGPGVEPAGAAGVTTAPEAVKPPVSNVPFE
ncbi:MAG: hypothetical protein ABIF71_11080 [Planctomycetota bacterium]